MKAIRISIVIVSYNNLQVLIDCVDSISKFNDIGEELEVIIVDNSTNNNVYCYIKENYKWIDIIKNENNGFGQGNNVGAKVANGEFLIFLNPDTILIEPIFKFVIQSFEKNPRLTLFGLKLVNRDLEWNMSYYFIDKHDFLSGQIIRLLNKFDIFFNNNMFISGANIFVRKNDFFNAGMFDENIFLYHEEPDLIKRIKSLGGRIRYFKSRRIIHLEGQTVNSDEFALKRRLESARYYSKKYGLSFQKQVKSEIRYNKIKLFIYKFANKQLIDSTKNKINVLKKYINQTD